MLDLEKISNTLAKTFLSNCPRGPILGSRAFSEWGLFLGKASKCLVFGGCLETRLHSMFAKKPTLSYSPFFHLGIM